MAKILLISVFGYVCVGLWCIYVPKDVGGKVARFVKWVAPPTFIVLWCFVVYIFALRALNGG